MNCAFVLCSRVERMEADEAGQRVWCLSFLLICRGLSGFQTSVDLLAGVPVNFNVCRD